MFQDHPPRTGFGRRDDASAGEQLMATVRDQIIDAAVAFLNANAFDGAPQVIRTLMEPSEIAQLPGAIVFPFREEIDPNKSGKRGPAIGRTLYLRFAAWAQADDGDAADRALDPILAWFSLIGGQTFGGLANDVCEHELTWQYDQTNYQVAGVALDFAIEYQTLRGDATQTGK
jgi:hypothetical protein